MVEKIEKVEKTDKAKRMFMTNAETIQAGILLQANMRQVEGQPYFEYNEGWSDERIAKEVGRINETHIARLRLTLNMPLLPSGRNKRDLEKMLGELTLKHNRLCDLLSLNKVVDARHLRIDDRLPPSNGTHLTQVK